MSAELVPLMREHSRSVREMINRCEAFDGVPRVLSQEEFDEEFAEPHYDHADDGRVAMSDGKVIGWARVWHVPSGEVMERAYLFGCVDPEHRRLDVGRELLGWSLTRAQQRLADIANDLPKVVRVNAFDFLEDSHRLYRRFGFEPVRYFEVLLRSLESLPGPAVPGGVRLVPFPLDRSEEVRAAKNESFADHWGSTPTSQAMWESINASHGSRLDMSFVAEEVATGRIVGHCLNHCYPEDDELLGRRDAIIDNLGTIREWRGRGLASAMIHASLRAFADDGRTHAMIEVDGASPTGASRLYRALGFEPLHLSITSELRFEP